MDIPTEQPHRGVEVSTAADGAAGDAGSVHELRPIENLKICPACLVQNTAANRFCTGCGSELPGTNYPRAVTDSAAETTAVNNPWPVEELPAAAPAPVTETPAPTEGLGRATRILLIAAGFALVAAASTLGILWRTEMSHANALHRKLHRTQTTLASTQTLLALTRAKLAATSSQSERRRQALVATQDVLAKVDPLLSSVDALQSKAADVGSQGSAITTDAESFISTVAGLVNYMIGADPSYMDYGWINGQIDDANSELASIRSDESAFTGSTAAYGESTAGFTTRASAFTQSVRKLQKQLKGAVGG